ncbi:TIGR00730 family Rossman fold protein [Bailinhaonella thermotolerans]|uniref:Cytokinin riboside 5'-monophosphate phosphoribohydrolase n=1 Tax=Bailinhaonella thermotolerans TaxID=1070861 RepID=A0A3A4B5M3_9ACTN|nr:TIGR00730 family Rossman fold protein [Bailinhaonella thermotolerans]RJL33637.1 TIGR00730 family Rossman fold protein [Bailinhaonella thermotolerans]
MAICVYCASSVRIDKKYVDLASEVGTELARRGHTLVTGGGRISCMGAVAAAARAGGSRTVGVIPEALMTTEIGDPESDELIVTPDMRSRKAEMDRRSDAFLVLPGGIGTLEELFEIWTSRVLGMHDRPLVILDPFGLYDPLRELITKMYDQGFTRPHVFDAVGWTASVPEAFDLLEKAARTITPSQEEVLESEA